MDQGFLLYKGKGYIVVACVKGIRRVATNNAIWLCECSSYLAYFLNLLYEILIRKLSNYITPSLQTCKSSVM